MRVVVDAMCAEYGGIRTYVQHLLHAWGSTHPEDDLHVVVAAGSDLDTGAHTRHDLPVRRPSVVGRPWAQTTAMTRLVRELRPDAVLATAPTTTVRRPTGPLAVAILDLRHEIRPDQFSRGRRLLRAVSYGRTYQLAGCFVSISQRSLDDLHELHPRTRRVPSTVAHLGADHVEGWGTPTRTGPAVSFAHHSNKNPDLLLDAWALLAASGDAPPLTLLGLGGERRTALQQVVDARGLGEVVTLAPFLPEADFRRTLLAADLVVFPSDFEGFGLPVVEGMLLGKPVVIGPDRGTLEVAGGHAAVMDGWTPEALADATRRARALGDAELAAARAWAERFRWSHTVSRTREALAGLVRP